MSRHRRSGVFSRKQLVTRQQPSQSLTVCSRSSAVEGNTDPTRTGILGPPHALAVRGTRLDGENRRLDWVGFPVWVPHNPRNVYVPHHTSFKTVTLVFGFQVLRLLKPKQFSGAGQYWIHTYSIGTWVHVTCAYNITYLDNTREYIQ